MGISFFKYQGTGNDFIMIDDRSASFPREDNALVASLCERRSGIGADGLILLEKDASLDFRMTYFNADGYPGSMCGNGARCIVAFARDLGIVGETCSFNAVDGVHVASIIGEDIRVRMQDVTGIKEKPQTVFLNTGSPHHVQMTTGLSEYDVKKEGAKIRYGLYGESGANINFVEPQEDGSFFVRTYERGVEDETHSCGTGVTAVAIAMNYIGKTDAMEVAVNTPGGRLKVSFRKEGNDYHEIFLSGPAMYVFKGEWGC